MKHETRYPSLPRRETRPVCVGGVMLGGGAPIVVQSMTNTQTADAEATLAQVRALASAGAALVRVATPTADDTAALAEIVAGSPVPIVADVHFHFQRAIEAIEAGVAKIRLNPGNLNDRSEVQQVIAAAKAHNVVIRVGVNEGSVSTRKSAASERDQPLVDLMCEKMAEYLDVFEEEGFEELVLSAKSHDPVTTVLVNRALAARWRYPLHLGVTHAGLPKTAAIRSSAALGALLCDGIGDTLRISYAGDPTLEVHDAVELLTSLRLREREGVELIACPTCGRLQTDLQPVLDELEAALANVQTKRPMTVAVMGCVVNGPGEADTADLAVCCGKERALLYRDGQKIRTLDPSEIVATILSELAD
jgi:(E)-4-hydroxy-3-methylbut-2-enyl-diphosphate synthase